MKLDSVPLRNRRVLWPIFVAGTIILILILPALPLPYRSSEVLIAAVGGLWALAFYFHQRHAEDARFLKELMSEFNTRYGAMNDELQAAIWSKSEFKEAQILKFIDYFNLCAEEWVFCELGYIQGSIWLAWNNGMRQYGKDNRVKELWLSERKNNSYYGVEFPIQEIAQ